MGRSCAAVLVLVVALAGCAAFVKTEGTSGPLAWRVTDMGTVTRSIAGQPVDTYDFTLVIKNTSDHTLALTRMDRTVYQAGSGQPGRNTLEGPWELRPGVERRFSLYSYTYCSAAQGCMDRGGAQPLWRIRFVGSDDGGRPIDNQFEIMLPPRSAAKTVDLASSRRLGLPVDMPPEGAIIAAKAPDAPLTQVVARAAASTLDVAAPVWSRGDAWEYRWQTPTGKGVFVWTVDREETVAGAAAYVIKVGTREIFYRKADIATVRETVDGTPVLVSTPPRLRYVWPLAVGKTWEQTFNEERTEPRNAGQRADVVLVEAEETVTVPAGTFTALKIVYRNKDTGEIRYEEWYAPQVRHAVLLRERLAGGILRVRELTSYTVR